MSDIKFLSDKATRQEHLSDLLDWMNVQNNIWAREYKTHRSPDDKLKLAVYDAAIKLLKGYLDSFSKDIPTDVEEPKIERERLADIDTRYNHLVTLLEMWRDAAECIKEQYVGKIVPPTAALSKIRMFERTVEIVEVYQEGLAGVFDYPGVSRQYPPFKEGSTRVLKPWCDDAYKVGVAANKKRLLDAANEKAQSEATEGQAVAESQVSSKDKDDDRILSDTESNEGRSQEPEDDPGFAIT